MPMRAMHRKRHRASIDGPRPVDIHVGSRVRLRRTLLGMSQEKLGEAIGLTFQQVQKYERGANRIGASRLYQFSQVLDVPVSFFFDDMANETAGRQGGFAESQEAFDSKELSKREILELARAFDKIKDEQVRGSLREFVKAFARTQWAQQRGPLITLKSP
jgi:transcriptional regulator with XRE-family HTH domain